MWTTTIMFLLVSPCFFFVSYSNSQCKDSNVQIKSNHLFAEISLQWLYILLNIKLKVLTKAYSTMFKYFLQFLWSLSLPILSFLSFLTQLRLTPFQGFPTVLIVAYCTLLTGSCMADSLLHFIHSSAKMSPQKSLSRPPNLNKLSFPDAKNNCQCKKHPNVQRIFQFV